MTHPNCDYISFEKDLALYFHKLDFPSSKDNLYMYQVWMNLVCWLWRRRFSKNFSVFLLFCHYLPLEKSYPLRLNKFESPLPKNDLCQVWLKLVQWLWRRSRKCKSSQRDRQTDGRSEKLPSAFSSGELKKKTQKKTTSIHLSTCKQLKEAHGP
jgi:hypothetical protein